MHRRVVKGVLVFVSVMAGGSRADEASAGPSPGSEAPFNPPFVQKIVPPPKVEVPQGNAGDYASPGNVEISAEKRSEIERMIRVTGMDKMLEQMKVLALRNARQRNPQVSDELWQRVSSRLNVESLKAEIMPIYDQHFSVEELRAVNEFYESPAGQKIAHTLPMLTDEFRRAGERWAIHAMKEMFADLEKSPPASMMAPSPPPTGREGDAKPVVILKAPPIYPAEMKALNVRGEVLVDFIVEPDGTVSSARALRGTNAVFGTAAIECVKSWRFKPGLKDGVPVRTHMAVPIIFLPNGESSSAPAAPIKVMPEGTKT